MTFHRRILVAQICFLGLGGSGLALGAGITGLQEEVRWLKEEQYVTTATKTKERIDKSGSTVSVITDKDLQRMGARTLLDALKRIPGIGLNIINVGMPSVEVRGVKTDFSEKVLFLINGHPVNNNLVNGGALLSRFDFSVEDIQAVEVVRGPGSALYGANAFVAVINIVTKTGKDMAGPQVSVSAGSFKSRITNAAYGVDNEDFQLAFNVNEYHTDGWKGEVERDSIGQSGETDYWQQRYEIGFQSSYKNFSIQGRYLEREASGYMGATSVLNTGSEQDYREYFIEGAYNLELNEAASVVTKLYFDHFQFDNLWDVLPPGVDTVNFPSGLFMRSPVKHDRTGGEVQLTWNWQNTHKVVAGAALEHQAQYDVELWIGSYISPPVDVSDSLNWNGAHNRDISAFYVQDIWDVNETLRLIAGARFDHYSDFGDSLNPRVSLSWKFNNDYQLIATYGSAFRAPTFGELYNTNNTSIVGNPDLEPEEIETIELGLRSHFSLRSQASITAFYNQIDNVIIPTVGQNSVNFSENAGELEVVGVELEYSVKMSNGSQVDFNYTYQDPTNKTEDSRAAEVPLHRTNLMYSHRFSRSFKGFVGLLYESELMREVGDIRDSVPEQTAVDLSLSWFSLDNNIVVTGSLYNAFDDDIVEPARDGNGNAMSDFPSPGRSFFIKFELATH